jgi:hypothetical protein
MTGKIEYAGRTPTPRKLRAAFRRRSICSALKTKYPSRAMSSRAPRGGEECLDEGAQKPLEPAQQAEVVAGGGEHGVDAVAVAALEVIAAHAVLGLDVPNDRLDCGARRFLQRR